MQQRTCQMGLACWAQLLRSQRRLQVAPTQKGLGMQQTPPLSLQGSQLHQQGWLPLPQCHQLWPLGLLQAPAVNCGQQRPA